MSAHHADPHLPPPEEEHRATNFVERTRLWDRKRNVWIAYSLFVVVCAAVFLADHFVHRHLTFEHVAVSGSPAATEHHSNPVPQESWLGFYGMYGFVGIVLLVVVSVILRVIVMRREDYYGE